MSVVLRIVLFSVAVAVCFAIPRNRLRRQAHVEFKAHFYPFREICAEKLRVPVSSILQTAVTGIPGGMYCSYYILQCQNIFGNVTRYLEQCGIGMWWSFKIGTCEIPSLTQRPECAAAICPPGQITPVPDPRACYGFYECEMGTGGVGQAFFEMCEDTSFFNPQTQSCENSATCDRPATKTLPNGTPACTPAQLPKVCTTPGYVPSLAYCGCVHQHLER